MIRKILKWIGIVLGNIVGRLVLAFVVLYIVGSVKWSRMHACIHITDAPVLFRIAQILGSHIIEAIAVGDLMLHKRFFYQRSQEAAVRQPG